MQTSGKPLRFNRVRIVSSKRSGIITFNQTIGIFILGDSNVVACPGADVDSGGLGRLFRLPYGNIDDTLTSHEYCILLLARWTQRLNAGNYREGNDH